jgi:hypothetical protein
MRYVIETNKVEVTNTIRSWKAKGVVDIVEQGDLREAMNEKLLIIKEAFFTIRKAGINIDLLMAYLRTETGLTIKDLNSVLKAQSDFFEKLTQGVQKK